MTAMRTLISMVAAMTAIASAADVREVRKTVPMDATGRFSLDTYKGSIHISAWDQPQVEIQARIEEDPGWHSMSVNDVEIRIDDSAGSVRVKTDYHHSNHWFVEEGSSPFVHYTIHVPRKASLAIKDYKSESAITGVEGDVEFETYKGGARIDGLRRGLQLKTYKGDVQAIFASFSAASYVDTYKGTVSLSMPKSSAFDLDASLERHANLDCDFPRTIRSSGGRHMTGAVNGGGAKLRVTSYRGDIRLRSI